MREVKLIHNPFTEKCSVYFDGNKYGTSTISSCLNEPFLKWADKIVGAISDECNDDYSLTYVGFEIYGRILKHFALKSALCQRFSIANPVVSESIKSRLGKLNQMCLNGFEIPRILKQINIYSDLPKEKAEAVLPKPARLAFCKMSFQMTGLALLQQTCDTEPCFVVSGKPPDTHKNLGECYYFQIADENKFCGIENGRLWEKCTADTLSKRLYEYIEMAEMTPLLHSIVNDKNVDKFNPLLQSFYMLDKIEAVYLIKIPASIELGKSEMITYTVLPHGGSVPVIKHSVLDGNIVRISNNHVEGIGTGDTFIDTVINGEQVSHQRIKSYRRNRAAEVDFPFPDLCMAVGEEIRVQLNYLPFDADNISLLEFDIVGSRVSLSRGGAAEIIIKALSPGNAKIIAKLEGLKTCLAISVFPKLKQLNIVAAKQRIAVGDIIKISLQPEPGDALIGDLRYEIIPNNIARYDTMIKAIVGQRCGNGKLVVTDTRNNIKSNFDFNVI